MAEERFREELEAVRPIDSEIASLAASLGAEIKTSVFSKPSTPNNLEIVSVPNIVPTHKRFLMLLSLSMLLVVAAIPVLFIAGAPCTHQLISFLTLAYIVADIGGKDSYVWLAMANLIAAAAVSPAAGTISDLFGRRYIALCGSAMVAIGMIIVGVSGRIEVAIGGMVIAGVGTGFAEIVGISGIAEIAPAKSRGMYVGAAFLMVLPFGGCAVYGGSFYFQTDFSAIVFSRKNMEMGSLDLVDY